MWDKVLTLQASSDSILPLHSGLITNWGITLQHNTRYFLGVAQKPNLKQPNSDLFGSSYCFYYLKSNKDDDDDYR